MAWIGNVTTMRLSDLSMMAECRDITGIFQYFIQGSPDTHCLGKYYVLEKRLWLYICNPV